MSYVIPPRVVVFLAKMSSTSGKTKNTQNIRIALKLILLCTLDGLHEVNLTPAGGSTKAPTGESSAASLPWMKKPLKVGLLPAAERVTAWE